MDRLSSQVSAPTGNISQHCSRSAVQRNQQLTLVPDNITPHKHTHLAEGENTLQAHMSYLDAASALGCWHERRHT